jgi:hypothetical protein
MNGTVYTNGSLFQQLSANDILNYSNPYPLHTQDPGVNLTILNDGSLQLNFKANDNSFIFATPLLLMLLNPNATIVSIPCSYPLSGQYDHLVRILFYVALVVSVVFRHHNIIASTALGSVMTYSTVSAIHLFVLLGQYGFGLPAPFFLNGGIGWNEETSLQGGDIDFWGILPIVTTTVIMLTPILTWSNTFRSNEAKILVVFWAIFMYAAVIPCYDLIWKWGSVSWSIDAPFAAAYCRGTDGRCDFPNNIVETWEDYKACDCVDFCALLSPTAPMRSGANMAPLLSSQIVENIIFKPAKNQGQILNNLYVQLVEVVIVFWGFSIIQGLLAIIHSFSSSHRIRNYIFRVVYSPSRTFVTCIFRGSRRENYINLLEEDPRYFKSPRIYIAKYFAAFYFLVTLLGLVIYPVFFVLTIFYVEVVLGTMTSSEHSDAIGAWAPSVAAVLILIAAAVVAYSSACKAYLSGIIRRPANHIIYDSTDRPEENPKDKSHPSRFSVALMDLRLHVKFKLQLKHRYFKEQVAEFREWWRDPVRSSIIADERCELPIPNKLCFWMS